MYKRWVSEGFTLTLIVSAQHAKMILVENFTPTLVKHYGWDEHRWAEREAETLARLGRMELVDVSSWQTA